MNSSKDLLKGADNMATESIERMAFVAVEVVIVILGAVFLLQILSGIIKTGNEESAFASAEKLRSAINEACIRNIDDLDNAIEVELKLNQASSSLAEIDFAESYVGKFLLKMSGDDPSYILYYEMFPPGEAVGWEVYHDIGYRAIGMLPENADYSTAGSFVTNTQALANSIAVEKPTDEKLTAFIGNVQPVSFDPTTGQETSRGYSEFFGLGEWEPHPGKESGNFIFDNYAALSVINKTLLKYLPCGNNSLCLKTTKGIYSFPLDYCKNIENIQYIQLLDPSQGVESKYSDFYLASPCEVTALVYLTDCSEGITVWNWVILPEEEGNCKRHTSYPMYSYIPETKQFKRIGEHTSCLDMMSDEPETGELKCVRVLLKSKEGFCYTINVKKDLYSWFVSPISTLFADKPVSVLTQYAVGNYFILKSSKLPGLGDALELGELWIWP